MDVTSRKKIVLNMISNELMIKCHLTLAVNQPL